MQLMPSLWPLRFIFYPSDLSTILLHASMICHSKQGGVCTMCGFHNARGTNSNVATKQTLILRIWMETKRVLSPPVTGHCNTNIPILAIACHKLPCAARPYMAVDRARLWSMRVYSFHDFTSHLSLKYPLKWSTYRPSPTPPSCSVSSLSSTSRSLTEMLGTPVLSSHDPILYR